MAKSPPRSSDRLRQQAEQLAAVLPPLLVEAERVASTVAQGVHGRRRVGTGETFWQFRRYHPGDEALAIDWRQSARSQHVFVREYEWEAAESVWLWRDGSASMHWASSPDFPSKRERADILMLALAALLVRGGERIALMGEQHIPRSGRNALTQMAETLLRQETAWDAGEAAGPSLPEPVQIPRYAHMVLVGDLLSPLEDIDAVVRRYAAAGVGGHLLQVIDPAEEDLPFAGRARFFGLEGEGDTTISRVETLRPEYQAKLAEHRQGLNDMARRVGWSFAVHRTDRPPQTALLALYAAISGELAGGRGF